LSDDGIFETNRLETLENTNLPEIKVNRLNDVLSEITIPKAIFVVLICIAIGFFS
jgi:hypothetical protein